MSIRNRNSQMIQAFTGMYVIEANIDAWGFPPEGWSFHVVPIFFGLDENGQPTGEMMDGSAWGENIPINMAPPIKRFFDKLKG